MKGINLMKTIFANNAKHAQEIRSVKPSVSSVPPCPPCLRVSLLLGLTLLALSCEQPFKAGLGAVVDVRAPTIRLVTPGEGSAIRGLQKFTGTAEDDYKLERIEIRITNFAVSLDRAANNNEVLYYYDNDQKNVSLDEWKDINVLKIGTFTRTAQNKGDWEFELDTKKFTDGDLKIQVRAVDSENKTAATDAVLFSVKNTPPSIVVTAPYVAVSSDEEDYEPGKIGAGERLNWNMGRGYEINEAGDQRMEDVPLSGSNYGRRMDVGSLISGTISHDQDLFLGTPRTDPPVDDEEEGKEWYPPQIRMWVVGTETIEDYKTFLQGEWPSIADVPWQTFKYTGNTETDNLFPLSIGRYQFSWPAPTKTGVFYGFEIRAQSRDGTSEFRYPRDGFTGVGNPEAWDDTSIVWPDFAVENMIKENRYVLFYLKEQSAFPTVDLYDLEDIDTQASRDKYELSGHYDPIPNVGEDHEYVNQLIVSKNSKFTLRYKASHPDRIGHVEVYWTREGSSDKGRFIWDLPNDFNATTAKEKYEYYSAWGTEAPTYGSDDPTRNYVFTYHNDPALDKVPSDANIHELVRGKSKIQKFGGSDAEWEKRKELLFPTRSSDANWTDEETGLPEGVYNLEVYARSPDFNGPVNYAPFTNTIRLDSQKPEMRFVTIRGAAELELEKFTAVVNGVIEVQVSFDDSRIVDSGLRTATQDYYEMDGTKSDVYSRDQRWLLVKDATEMEKVIGNHTGRADSYWPLMPDNTGKINIPHSETASNLVIKHGPVSESKFRLKTSTIYDPADLITEADSLADDTYYLYVFVRDNAFNVEWQRFEIEVKKSSDEPTIDFLGEIKGTVKNPNVTGQEDEDGFKPDTLFINNLGPGSNIRMRLRDDDSLDLGTDTDPSSVKVYLSASRPADLSGDNITAMGTDPDYLIDLSGIVNFGSQPVVNGERQAVLTQEGSINQSDLFTALAASQKYIDYGLFAPKGGPSGYNNNLPDGIYKLTVLITDYGNAKMKMPKDTNLETPESVEGTTEFWFHVESTIPDMSVTSTTGETVGGWINPENVLGTNDDGIIIKGTISDRNGPVTVRVMDIIDEELGRRPTAQDPGGAWGNKVSTTPFNAPVELDTNPLLPEHMWNGTFEVPVHIDRTISANLVIALQAEDRFGRTRRIEQKYKLDLVPPEVTLQREIDNFVREDTVRLSTVHPDDRKRLSNGVVYFNINATDNLRVSEVRWWLLPWNAANTMPPTFSGWAHTQTPADGKYGDKTSNFSGRTFIDTTIGMLDNRRYSLYIMAKDSAGRYSDMTKFIDPATVTVSNPNGDPYPNEGGPLQTIFVRQQEDAPWFESTNLSGDAALDKSELLLSFSISDDDGFFTSANAVRPGMLTIYLGEDNSNTDHSGDIGSYNSSTGKWNPTVPNATFYTALPIVSGDDGATITSMGSKSVTFTIKLNDVADTAFKNKLTQDGRKHLIIEATDSNASKWQVNGTPAADTPANERTWRQYYRFTLDSSPPDIDITAPTPAVGKTLTYGGTPANFNVEGTIHDTYLKTKDNNYYFKLRLDGKTIEFPPFTSVNGVSKGVEEFKLGTAAGGMISTLDTSSTNAISLDFAITNFATEVLATSSMPYASIDPGYHTLTFIVEDESGQNNSASINFIKDTTAPDFRFASFRDATITVNGANVTSTLDAHMGTTMSATWWTSTTNPANYTTKRNTALPVISYDLGATSASTVPKITGTFSDDASDIDPASFNIYFDGSSIPISLGAAANADAAGLLSTGKNVTWQVYLTKDGTLASAGTSTNPILVDGAHSIQLEVADAVGNPLPKTALYGFRIVSTTPEAEIKEINDIARGTYTASDVRRVFGDRTTNATTNPTTAKVFTIEGEATGYNVDDVEIIIRYTDAVDGSTFKPYTKRVSTIADGTPVRTWSFTVTPTPPDLTTTPPDGNGREKVLEKYSWTLDIPRSYILEAGKDFAPANPVDLNKMRAGNYEIVAIAIDRSRPNAKRSEETSTNVWQFVVDSTTPTFSFNLIYDDLPNPAVADNTHYVPTYWANSANVARRNLIQGDVAGEAVTSPATPTLPQNPPLLRGRVTDDNNNLADVQIQLGRWDYTNATQNTNARWQIYNRATNTWATWTAALAANDNYWISVYSTTAATPDTPVSGYDLNWSFDQLWTNEDGENSTVRRVLNADGYYRVRMRARDLSKAAGNASAGWTTNNDGNPAYSPYAFFFLDCNTPKIASDSSNSGYYSSRHATSGINVVVNITEANRLEKLEVAISPVGTIPNLPATMPPIAPITTLTWSAANPFSHTITIPFIGTTYPDGTYKITYTATDLAGKSSTFSDNIRLDNNAPSATITAPRVNDIQVGGQTFTIEGSTDDLPVNGSASGPSEIWYRLGYGSQTALPTLTYDHDNNPATPPIAMPPEMRSAAIMAWAAHPNSGVTGFTVDPLDANKVTTNDTGKAFNTNFDTAALRATTSSLWFKYTETTASSTYDSPAGFANIAASELDNLYIWSLNANGLGANSVATAYATGSVTLKGSRTYTGGVYSTGNNARYLSRSITGATDYTHSLPLVIRVVDAAGNVFYEMREILLNPNGDNPTTVINYPTDRSTAIGNPYGGQINIRGVAKDNISVRNVIYRVKVDGRQASAAGTIPGNTLFTKTGQVIAAGDNGIVVNSNWKSWNAQGQAYTDMLAKWNTYGASGANVVQANGTGALNKDGWYVATLESPLSMSTPWNFMLNESGEISELILAKGWKSDPSALANDTIRVWIEAFVFDGVSDLDTAAYNLMSLGENGPPTPPHTATLPTDATKPRPYVREFYFTTKAPSVKNPRISVLGRATAFTTTANGTSNDIQAGTRYFTFANHGLAVGDTVRVAGTDRYVLWVNGSNFKLSNTYTMNNPATNVWNPAAGDITVDPFSPYTSEQAENNIRSKQFAIQATLDGNGPIGQIQVRLRDETSDGTWTTVFSGNTPVTTKPGLTWSDPVVVGGGNTAITQYTLTYSFDSIINENGALTAKPDPDFRSVRGGNWKTLGGTFIVDVNVQDLASPPVTIPYTFEIGVDNFTPVADKATKITPRKVAGSNVDFLGRVFDYSQAALNGTLTPPHRGIKEVRVWFTDNGDTQYIKMTTGNDNGALTAKASVAQDDSITAQKTRTATVTYSGETVTTITGVTEDASPSVQSHPDAATSTAAPYVRKITSAQGAGMIWQPSSEGADVYWMLNLSTIGWPDGWIKMHYIVIDDAGNAGYYTQEMIVMNRKPRIKTVTLYTDNTGEGAVYTTHTGNEAKTVYDIPEAGKNSEYTVGKYNYADGYLDSQFISKNNVISFGVDTLLGTDPLHYKAHYVERYLVPLSKNNLLAMAAGADNDNASLAYLPNGATLERDGTPSTTTTQTAVAGFINLYTIAPGTSKKLTPDIWQELGVKVDPIDGTHFVFQMTAGDVGNMDRDTVYVYAYRSRLATGLANRPDPSASPPDSTTDRNVTLITNLTSPLTFSTTAHFEGDGKINEAQAKDPSINAYYTASTTPSVIDTASQGTAFFVIKVYDTVAAITGPNALTVKEMLYDAVVIGMKVYVGDRRKPYSRLYDLNPYTEPEVIGNNVGTTNQESTRNAAALPGTSDTGIGVNVKRGGLYNVGTVKEPIKSGYIDPRFGANAAAGSTAINPYITKPSDPLNPYTNLQQDRPDWYVSSPADSVGTGTATVDKVSGKIILRGIAWDDQLIDEIKIKIGGNAAKTILKLEGTPRRMTPKVDGAWAYEELHWQTGHTVEWAYLWDTEVEPTNNNADTPVARAKLPLNTVPIIVEVVDKNGGQSNEPVTIAQENGTQNAAQPWLRFHNTVTVDIVPYVTGFKRASAQANTRSRQGWYSFYQGETGIQIQGYNLGTAALTMNIQSAAATTESITTYTSHVFSVPTTANAKSGRLNITVPVHGTALATATAIHNHTSAHANKSWNRETSESVAGSALWNNKPHAHIWRTNESGNVTGTPRTYFGGATTDTSAEATSPGMALEYVTGTGANPGRLHAVWSDFGAANYRYGHNGDGTRTALQNGTGNDPFAETDISIYNGQVSTSTTTDNTNYTHLWRPNFTAVFLQDGGPGITFNSIIASNNTSDRPTATYAINDQFGQEFYMPTERWRNNRIVKADRNTANDNNAPGKFFLTAYDSYNKYLHFVQVTGTDAANKFMKRIDGGGTIVSPVFDIAGTLNEQSDSAGEFSAVDYDNVGPVVAYYDEANNTIRIALGTINTRTISVTVPNTNVNGGSGSSRPYQTTTAHGLSLGDIVYVGNTMYFVRAVVSTTQFKLSTTANGNNYNPTATNTASNLTAHSDTWTRKDLFPANSGFGRHISMKVDRRDGIHLAFYDSVNQKLRYAYMSNRTATLTTADAVIVDSVINGGELTDISVDNYGNPYIVYSDTSRLGNRDGARMAYRSNTSYNSGIAFTDAWEAVTMPSAYTVNRDRLNIEAWPPSNRKDGGTAATPTAGTLGTAPGWNAAIGYASDRYRIGYFYVPTYKGY